MRSCDIALISILFLGACGGGDSIGPSTGTLTVQFDAATCHVGKAEILIDATSQGAFIWTSGQSRDWSVAAGSHTVGAREVGGSLFVWPVQHVTVPGGGTFNAIFTC
jgi:hypothetical protein